MCTRKTVSSAVGCMFSMCLLGPMMYRVVQSSISLVIFCLDVLSIIKKVLKSPIIIVEYLKFCQFLPHISWGSVVRCVFLLYFYIKLFINI